MPRNCLTCGNPAPEAARRCAVCHTPLVDEREARGLGITRGRVSWRVEAIPRPKWKGKLAFALVLLLLTSVASTMLIDTGFVLAGFAAYIPAIFVVGWIIRRDPARQR